MIRQALKMKLKPGYEAEYKKRHDQIWPELRKFLSDSGIYDYSIFLDEETLTLFAVMKLIDNNIANDVPNHPINRKWWNYMSDIMEYKTDNTPVAIPLKEVFHMD
ncbi:MAG: L-rhamnose mutarotase [Planctomycetes bacterium GWF2_41_51]|nr:MAG: L-rhamnose mutarotase [Planctomycetes bacterium GWF2_41_51]HBG28564.1 L-rhamnose mutarotase [Phycisphaerales bacterium]